MKTIVLPTPRYDSGISIEHTLRERRSVREFNEGTLTLTEISQLLWAAQGITSPEGFRTTPSAGALYPLEVHIAVGHMQGLEDGIYKYQPHEHKLTCVIQEDKRRQLARAALGQSCVNENAALLVFSAVVNRTTQKYGQRGIRYVHIEVGHAAQNVFLQVRSLGLVAVVIGAFDDKRVRRIVEMSEGEQPLYLMPIGRPGTTELRT